MEIRAEEKEKVKQGNEKEIRLCVRKGDEMRGKERR